MGFLSGLKSFFTSDINASTKAEEVIEHNGFSIVPAPMSEGGQYRVAATISKGEGDDCQTHTFIRSDLVGSRDECITVTVRKAKMTIDQLGDRIFS